MHGTGGGVRARCLLSYETQKPPSGLCARGERKRWEKREENDDDTYLARCALFMSLSSRPVAARTKRTGRTRQLASSAATKWGGWRRQIASFWQTSGGQFERVKIQFVGLEEHSEFYFTSPFASC